MKKKAHIFTVALAIMLLTSWAAVDGLQSSRAETNDLERTPTLGWSSWSFLRERPTAAKIEAQARALQDSGLQKIGYEYVNLDDFWYQCPGRQGPDVGPYGLWVTDSSRFPSHGDTDGIKAVADYIHSLGLKFGIYVTPGISRQAISKNTPIKGTPYTAAEIADPSVQENNYNCHGMAGINYNKPGSQEYIDSWADMLASWGVDYVKIDGVRDGNAADVKAWSNAIRKSGRPMVLDVTQGSFTRVLAPTLITYANQWEPPPDIECYRCEKGGSSYPLTIWANIAKRFNYAAEWQPYAHPGGFTDYDSIEVGNGSKGGLTPAERQTQMSLWALGSSPLILGVDLTHLDQPDLRKYLKNAAVLAVDQDSIAAKRVAHAGNRQVFAKVEPSGDAIVGFFNTGGKTERISIRVSVVGLAKNKRGYSSLNLWTGERRRAGGAIRAMVPSHGVVLYRIRAL